LQGGVTVAGTVDGVARIWADGLVDVDGIVETGVDGSRGCGGPAVVVGDSDNAGGNIDGCSCVDAGCSLGVVAAAFTSIPIKLQRSCIVVVVSSPCKVIVVVKSSRSAAWHDMWVRLFAASLLNTYSSLTTKPGDINKTTLPAKK